MCHALIIEDDYGIAMQIAELLTAMGVTSVAMAATEAVAVATALQQRPAIILSDVRLAEGTGPGAVRAILSALGPIPVVFVTGSPDECDPRIAAAAILTKPFLPQLLIGTVGRLVSECIRHRDVHAA
jgi:CheY-like chemotaxis protein